MRISAVIVFVVLGLGLGGSITATTAIADVRIAEDGSGRSGAQIQIAGAIKKGDAASFKRAADYVSKRTKARVLGVPLIQVDLNSPGGDVMEAVTIGKEIRSRFMLTAAVKRECSSACVFILVAGVSRAVSERTRIGLHRPYFQPEYFASLTPEQARVRYHNLVEWLRRYFLEMGGDERAFRILMRTRSDQIYFANDREIDEFGFRGSDAAWEELAEAKSIQRFGRRRWSFIKSCLKENFSFEVCQRKSIDFDD